MKAVKMRGTPASLVVASIILASIILIFSGYSVDLFLRNPLPEPLQYIFLPVCIFIMLGSIF